MTVSIFAPISIGNVSVGFDTLGLALSPINGEHIGDTVTVESVSDINSTESFSDEFLMIGKHSDKLPSDKESNIVWQCLLRFKLALSEKKIKPTPVKITLHKNIPVSSGLGSSACSIVAAFVALNEYYQSPFKQDELLHLMGELEAAISGSLHYDNVAPCYLGGLQLMLNHPNKISQALPLFNDVYWVIAYPDVKVSTKAAREILPAQYSRQTLIQFGQNLAGFIDASYRQEKQEAFSYLVDVVAEPYRASLLPNFNAVKQSLLEQGSLAVGISGSGPTIFSVCETLEQAKQQANWLDSNYLQTPQGFVHICKADQSGARSITGTS